MGLLGVKSTVSIEFTPGVFTEVFIVNVVGGALLAIKTFVVPA